MTEVSMQDGRIDLNGQVAVVSGAGRGVGRAYALLLASRGACLVVNDLGTDTAGGGADSAVANAVVAEIEQSGGQAVASGADISTEEGGRAVVDAAVATYGRIDVLIHNAGFPWSASFEDPFERARRMFDVHMFGAWHLGQPAWRAMTAQGYGRIVFTSSASIYGMPGQSVYATVKAGVIGLTRSLQAEARLNGMDVKVNTVLPYAATRLNSSGDIWEGRASPEEVAAVVAYLASRDCRLEGEVLVAGASHVARLGLLQTRGWTPGRAGLTPEDVSTHLDEIRDPTDAIEPGSVVDYLKSTFELVMNRPAGSTFDYILTPKAHRARQRDIERKPQPQPR